LYVSTHTILIWRDVCTNKFFFYLLDIMIYIIIFPKSKMDIVRVRANKSQFWQLLHENGQNGALMVRFHWARRIVYLRYELANQNIPFYYIIWRATFCETWMFWFNSWRAQWKRTIRFLSSYIRLVLFSWIFCTIYLFIFFLFSMKKQSEKINCAKSSEAYYFLENTQKARFIFFPIIF